MPLGHGQLRLSVNFFLFLTLSHHYYSCNTFTPDPPLSFRYALPVPHFFLLRFTFSVLV